MRLKSAPAAIGVPAPPRVLVEQPEQDRGQPAGQPHRVRVLGDRGRHRDKLAVPGVGRAALDSGVESGAE
nr:hypothetical protein [Fodinicola feengrottensis]